MGRRGLKVADYQRTLTPGLGPSSRKASVGARDRHKLLGLHELAGARRLTSRTATTASTVTELRRKGLVLRFAIDFDLAR
jgi:hypothetical protein